jgi:putative hydrolase of the HAD superfamily
MLDCVLFDLDGLLVDSEPLQFRAYQYAFTQFGITLTMDDWIRWHSNEASTARWVESEELDIDVQQLRTVKKSRYDEMIANELKAKPGAVALVESCASSLKLALVSASRRESIEACLGKFGILHHFSVLVSGSEVARSKPWPDPYLAAMQALDTTPNHAIALEDSLTGYRAAGAAGLGCVVCPDHFIPKLADAFDGAALVTDSLASLSIDILHGIHSASDTPDN